MKIKKNILNILLNMINPASSRNEKVVAEDHNQENEDLKKKLEDKGKRIHGQLR